jgi:opacity protein-like surface antigen
MIKSIKVFALALSILTATCGAALATPSTQIWIPSTDIQPYKTLHLGFDNYIRTSKDSDGRRTHVYDAGLTVGVLPFEKLQMELGIDYLVNGTIADDDPIYFNAKIGTPEDSLFKFSPALAVGIYNLGTNWDKNSASRNDLNMGYALAAKTIPVIGRLSAGYYIGNSALLQDSNGKHENDGVLLSWDRTLSEISDKLWAAVDYQGGDNAFGALSFGVSWAFSKNVSVVFGYDIYNHKAKAGQNTFTTQVDINFP